MIGEGESPRAPSEKRWGTLGYSPKQTIEEKWATADD
jgi:hypothetical protein